MCLRMHIVLLLFAVGSYAHTLSRIQITNGSDIYEIIEKPNNMFEIIDPKPKKSILREIIFFKIIETPYHHLKKEKSSQDEGLDFDDSKRPFTNGPGFQFLDYDPKDNSTSDSKESNNDSSENDSHDSKPESHDKSDSSKSDRDDGDSDRNKEIDDGESSNESKDEKETKSDSKNENKDKVGSSFNIDKRKDKDHENKESDIKDTDKTDEQSDDKNIKEYKDTITSDVSKTTETAATLNKTEKAIQQRNKKFDLAKDKYEEMNKKSDILRRKRDIDFGMPPPPPALPPLNIGMFPDFIQRMITNNPAFRDIVSPDDGVESYNQDESKPGTYGFHLNKDNGHVWNHLPFINQDSYINEPSNMINKEKDDVYSENSPSSEVSNSDSDDNSVSSNDIGYNVGAEEGTEKSTEDDSSINPPLINFNNFKPNTITKEKDLSNLSEYEPTQQVITETNIKYPNKNVNEKVPEKIQKISEPPKTKININKDLKEKIEMSFDNIGKMVPPLITRFEEKLVKTALDNNKPLTFGMKLGGDNGYVWNDLSNPGNPFFVGETLDKNKVTESKSPEPTTDSENSNKPNKESLDKEKNKSADEAVPGTLDDFLKKDEFWQWLTKWTAAYMAVLNEHVEELVKREVEKQVNKTMNHQKEEEKDKIYINNKDLDNKNKTIANVTTVDTANKTNEASNNTATGKSNPETNKTDVKLAPETDKINSINETASDSHKNNKTSPTNASTIFGNAIDSDHVTNIFIFYPNANENNATAKEIDKILGKPNNNVVVLGTPSNDNKSPTASDSNTNPPVDYNTGIYAIDKKKDTVSNTTESTNKTSESASNRPSKGEATSNSTAKKEGSTAAPITNTSDTLKASSSNTESNTNASTDTNTKASKSTNVNNSDTTKTVSGATVPAVAPNTSTSKS